MNKKIKNRQLKLILKYKNRQFYNMILHNQFGRLLLFIFPRNTSYQNILFSIKTFEKKR